MNGAMCAPNWLSKHPKIGIGDNRRPIFGAGRSKVISRPADDTDRASSNLP